MSISNEIQRLQEAKADIKEAIENKGVAVASSLTISDYAPLIDSIPQSGGQRITTNFTQFKNYDTFLDLINDITPILVPNKVIMATWTFINNTENTRAGIYAIICMPVDAYGALTNVGIAKIYRVGYTAQSVNYGVDVYAGATCVCDYMYGESSV